MNDQRADLIITLTFSNDMYNTTKNTIDGDHEHFLLEREKTDLVYASRKMCGNNSLRMRPVITSIVGAECCINQIYNDIYVAGQCFTDVNNPFEAIVHWSYSLRKKIINVHE